MKTSVRDGRRTHWCLPMAAVCGIVVTLPATAAAERAGTLRRTAYCAPAPVPPHIDGELDDACWRGPTVQNDFFALGRRTRAAGKTEIMFTRDRRALYVAGRCYSGNLERMVAKATKRDGRAWQDDCVEWFFVPASGVCYHLAINSTGKLYDARSDRESGQWDPDLTVACGKRGDADGRGYWSLEVAIPWSALGGAPESGKPWTTNLTRNETVRAELSTWSIIEDGGFEQPERFGQLVFRPPTGDEIAAQRALLAQLAPKEEDADAEPLRAVPARAALPVAFEKLAVADCRVARAFTGAPVDGSTPITTVAREP